MNIRPRPLEEDGDWRFEPLENFPAGLFGKNPLKCKPRSCKNDATCVLLYWMGGVLHMFPMCPECIPDAVEYFRKKGKD